MFPLKKRKLIRGCEAHKKAGLGCAADYEAHYTMLFAPFDGVIITWWGWQGGKWLSLKRDNGDRIQFAHLSKYHRRLGKVKQGELLGWTGNTGNITTGPHLHIQIKDKNGKRLDPVTYNWGNTKTMATDKLTKEEVINQYILMRRYFPKPKELKHWTGKRLIDMQETMKRDDRNLLDK